MSPKELLLTDLELINCICRELKFEHAYVDKITSLQVNLWLTRETLFQRLKTSPTLVAAQKKTEEKPSAAVITDVDDLE